MNPATDISPAAIQPPIQDPSFPPFQGPSPSGDPSSSAYIPPAFPQPMNVPMGFSLPGPTAAPALPPVPLPSGWTEHIAPNGIPYYYHAASNNSTYVRPVNPHESFTPAASSSKPPKARKEKREKPVSKQKVPGTRWVRVKTNKGNVFYRNASLGVSTWEAPQEIWQAVELLERASLEAEEASAEEEETESRKRPAEGEAGGMKKRAKVVIEEERDPNAPQEKDDSLEDEGEADEEEARLAAERWAREAEEEKQRKAAEEAAQKAAEEKAREEAAAVPTVTPEEARALFRQLLEDLRISPLAPYEDALPMLLPDPRYKLITSAAEKQEVFNQYCRDAARAKAASLGEKAGPKLSAEEEYMRLLKEDVTSTRTSWTEWRKKWKKDRRFWGWATERERETRFRQWLKDLGEKKRKEKEDAERGFREMLLQAKEVVLTPETKWAEVKKHFQKDARYDAVGSSSLREELFNAYAASLRGKSTATGPSSLPTGPANGHAANPTPAPAEKHESKLERQQRALRERESQVRHDLLRAERQAEQSRSLLGAEEGERAFGSLLVDAVRELDQTWAEALPMLRTDPRFAGSRITLARQRQMFEDHLASLRNKQMQALEMLFEAHAPELNTPFSALPVSLVTSLPATKLGLSPRTLEKEYEQWTQRRQQKARKEFEEMLKENSFAVFWGRARKLAQRAEGGEELAPGVLEETAQYGDEEEFVSEETDGAGGLGKRAKEVGLKELERVLQQDRRWRAWDWKREERGQWLQEWLERLEAPGRSVHTGDA